MKYELIKNSNQGVIIDNAPILQDIKETFEISFILPEDGAYIALFRGENNVEYKAIIRDGTVRVPKDLLVKEQHVGLTVCLINGDKIMHSWECHSLRIGSFLFMRQTQWQITAGVDDKEIYARLADIERCNAELKQSLATLGEFIETIKKAAAEREKESLKIKSNFAALLRFAFKDYNDNVYLKGGSMDEFLKEFRFELTNDEVKNIFGGDNND